MLEAVSPGHSQWLYEFVLSPYMEGAARLNRAWAGIDFHSLRDRSLSLRERVVSFIGGLSLLLPLVNVVIWVVWQTFGHPEILAEPFRPNEAAPERSPVQKTRTPVALAAVEEAAAPSRAETFRYRESMDGEIDPADWTVQFFPHEIVAKKTSSRASAISYWTPDWQAQRCQITFHCAQKGIAYPGETVEGTLLPSDSTGKRRLKIVGQREGELIQRELVLEKDLPWIQQSTLGFKKFIPSSSKELSYYAIDPRNFDLVEMRMEKQGIERLEGFGDACKVELRLGGWKRHLGSAWLWFHPTTGILYKTRPPKIPFVPYITVELEKTGL